MHRIYVLVNYNQYIEYCFYFFLNPNSNVNLIESNGFWHLGFWQPQRDCVTIK